MKGKDEYIVVRLDLMKKFNLKGNELLITSLIYNYSSETDEGYNYMRGGSKYVSELLGITERQAGTILRKLVERGVIIEETITGKFTHRKIYRFNFDFDSEKEKTSSSEKEKTSSSEKEKTSSSLYNMYGSNYKGSNNREEMLFQKDFETTPTRENNKKTLFRNSDVYKLVSFDENGVGIDYSEFEKKFSAPEFQTIDLIYYFHTVSDWSDQKNEKRTKNGWLATVRNFIRGDKDKGRLHLKPEYQNNAPGKIDIVEAMKYLNDEY